MVPVSDQQFINGISNIGNTNHRPILLSIGLKRYESGCGI